MTRSEGLSFLPAGGPRDYDRAKELFLEYARSLSFDLCFQGIDAELAGIATIYGGRHGGIILVKDDRTGGYIGCAGIRRMDSLTAELKRMYVREEYRGRGLGRALLDRAIRLAKDLGYRRVRLDTMATMTRAIALYKAHGFRETEPYRYNPETGALFFELDL